jgi:transposase, IS30 family
MLNKSERTIRRKIKRGLTINLTSELEEIEVYSADISNDEYKANMRAKGQELKIGSDRKTIELIEQMIKEEKKLPEVVAYELAEKGLLEITARTIRNYIYDVNVFNLTSEGMIYKKEYKSKNKEKRIAKHTPPEKSIENRPEKANNRSEYGHWEGDLIIGKRKKDGYY